MSTILIQMAEQQWTEEALHLACAMARSTNRHVTLLNLMEVQHYSWLGTTMGITALSQEESARIWDYKAIAEKYGCDLCVQPFQYFSLIGALVDAADEFDAAAVFARVPRSAISMWRKYQLWDLRRQLTKRGRALYTLDQPDQSAILMQPERSSGAPNLA